MGYSVWVGQEGLASLCVGLDVGGPWGLVPEMGSCVIIPVAAEGQSHVHGTATCEQLFNAQLVMPSNQVYC